MTITVFLACALLGRAGQEPPAASGVRFVPVDIVVDTGAAQLAAYQVEIIASSPAAKIAGVEGCEPQAFREAPYYDPTALQGERIILAAFTTDPDAPSGHFRVARLHMMEPAAGATEYTATVMAAAGRSGQQVALKVECLRQGGEK